MDYTTATIDATRDNRTETIDLEGIATLSELANKLWEEFPLGVHDGGEFDSDPDTDEMPEHVTLTNSQGFAVHLFMVKEGAQEDMEPVVNFDELAEAWNDETDDDRREAMGEYLDDMGADDLSDFDESYQGRYDSGADFAQRDSEQHLPNDFPTWIVIDWEQTWEQGLRYDYHITESGHVFRNL